MNKNTTKQMLATEYKCVDADICLNESFGDLIFTIRRIKKQNATTIAKLANTDRGRLRKHEKGQMECPVKKADELCQALGFKMFIIFKPIDCKGFEYKCNWQDVPKALCYLRVLTGQSRRSVVNQLVGIKNIHNQDLTDNIYTAYNRITQYESGATNVSISFLATMAKFYKHSVSISLVAKEPCSA